MNRHRRQTIADWIFCCEHIYWISQVCCALYKKKTAYILRATRLHDLYERNEFLQKIKNKRTRLAYSLLCYRQMETGVYLCVHLNVAPGSYCFVHHMGIYTRCSEYTVEKWASLSNVQLVWICTMSQSYW